MKKNFIKKIHYSFYIFLLKLENNISKLYERKVAPFIAYNLKYLLVLIEKILIKKNFVFIKPISHGIGASLPSIHHFILLKENEKIDPKKKYIWVTKKNSYFFELQKIFKDYFYLTKQNNLLYYIILPLLLRDSKLTLSIGHEGVIWSLPKNKDDLTKKWFNQQTYIYRISRKECEQLWNKYYDELTDSKGTNLFSKNVFINTKNHFINENKKNVLIHIRDFIRNASLSITDPKTYEKTINYLFDNNYNLIFIGRNKMPDNFKNYPIKNYANSEEISIENDLRLFNHSFFSIVCAAGIGSYPTVLNRPFLNINSAEFIYNWSSDISIFVPALLNFKDNSTLKFSEIINLNRNKNYKDLIKSYIPINVDDTDILNGCIELEKFISSGTFNETNLSIEYYRLMKKMNITNKRKIKISNLFLEKYSDRIG